MHYGPVERLYRVMYDGYSLMPVKYVCAFEGQEPPERCDYGVEVNTFQVKLPRGMKAYSPEASTDKQWVRRERLLAALELLGASK